MWKSFTTFSCAVACVAALTGCAGLNQLSSDVSTYSQWPSDRKPSTYVFDRLPSQQAYPEQQEALETAASRALELAGFTRATDPKAADVTVQVGARVSYADRSPYDDPFWWHGGLFQHRFYGRPYWRTGFGFGYPFGYPYGFSNYEREVALLIRDRKTGQPLYEARAVSDGSSPAINSLLGAMFEAALKDFPNAGANPHRVVTQIAG